MLSDLPLTAGALTGILAGAGRLPRGEVSGVSVDFTRETVLSRISRLRLTYRDPTPDTPKTLIFKTGRPERVSADWGGGRQEVAFYAEVAASTPALLTPRCFEAVWDAGTNDYRLILEDLGDSHRLATVWPLPPTLEDCERILRAWARFHAHWWDNPRLGVSVGRWGDASDVEGYLRRLGAKYEQFADRLGDRLPLERRQLYERLLDRAPELMKRTDSRRGVTIVHGDAHFWNCFLPHDGGADVRLFDWDSWRLGVATEDLAYMIAVHWYPDRRRRMETLLLDAYHASLLDGGVSGYDRRALADDYRLSALSQIMTPVWQSSIDIPPVIWWNNFERIHLAVEDLNCRELLA